jgi:hypothetical protein
MPMRDQPALPHPLPWQIVANRSASVKQPPRLSPDTLDGIRMRFNIIVLNERFERQLVRSLKISVNCRFILRITIDAERFGNKLR